MRAEAAHVAGLSCMVTTTSTTPWASLGHADATTAMPPAMASRPPLSH